MAASEIARDGRGEATEPRTLQPGRTLPRPDRSLRRGPETRPLPRPRRGHLGLGAGGHHRDVAPGLVPFATHGLKLHHPLQFVKDKKTPRPEKKSREENPTPTQPSSNEGAGQTSNERSPQLGRISRLQISAAAGRSREGAAREAERNNRVAALLLGAGHRRGSAGLAGKKKR